MKTKEFTLLMVSIWMILVGMAQIPSDYGSSDSIQINRLKKSYAYTPQQVIETLGQSTDSCSWMGSSDEITYEFVYKTGDRKDLRIRFGSIARSRGIEEISLTSSRYSISIHGVGYTVGEPISKFTSHPSFKASEWELDG